MRSISGSFVGVLVGVLVIIPVLGLGLPVVAHAGGDAAAGKAKGVACQACHVADTGGVDAPHLAGQRATYLVKQLKAFKAGDRKNPVMSAITSVLSDADIDNLATFWSSQPAGSDTTVPPEVAAIKKSKMTFPPSFPKGFVLYGSVNKEDQNTVVKQYINEVGFQAVKAGKPVPDGSVIIVASYAAKLGADKKPVADKDGTWVPDQAKGYEGMEARAGWGKDIPELIRNVNWNYTVFGPDKAPKTDVNQAICLACHVPAAKTSYVFGLPKIQAKAGVK
jgi:cytochrome c553